MKAPLLTVIIPVHNVAAYIDRSLKSIVNQTYRNTEIIIVDDASKDETGALVDAWGQKDPRIKVYHLKANMGISGARNHGLAQATGEYVTFADGDDWCEPNLFEFYINRIQKYNLDFVSCGYFVDPVGQPSGQSQPKDVLVDRKPLLKLVRKMKSPIRGYTWNKCYRRSLIIKHDLRFNENIGLMEDQVFNVAYILKAKRYLYNVLPLYHYVQRPGSSIHQPSIGKGLDVTKAICWIQTAIWASQWRAFKQAKATKASRELSESNK
ncbi:MAG: glycosyltransferase [Lactobacillus sp.]|jgi:glycosyltransferase involved in cell wall biosynthesis|nr:glycosyltransferase [Lactobacillus sp.]